MKMMVEDAHNAWRGYAPFTLILQSEVVVADS